MYYKFNIRLAILIALLGCSAAFAQRKKPVTPVAVVAPAELATPVETKEPAKAAAGVEFKMLGMIGAAYSEDMAVLTCGGPKFGFSYGWFSLSVGFYPSLVYSDIYKNASAATPLRPNLGAGPEIGFGKVSIIAPIYYMPGDKYRYTFGVGYRF